MIDGKIERELISLRGETSAITGGSDYTALGIYPNGNDDTVALIHTAVNVANDFLTGQPAVLGKVLLQPSGERLLSCPAGGVGRAHNAGNAQTNVDEIKLQQSDQRVGKSGSHGGRFPADPRRRYRGQRHQIPEHGSQRDNFGVGIDGHSVRRGRQRVRGNLHVVTFRQTAASWVQ